VAQPQRLPPAPLTSIATTIAYWRRTSLPFRTALSHAQYDKAMFVREEAETHVAEAFEVVHAILNKPDASDSVRLNAAKYIIDKASTPPPPKPELLYKVQTEPHPFFVPAETAPEPEKPEIVHSNAQSRPTPFVRSTPKVGRNEPCPCGSQLKFKRCCLGKATLTQAA
jgi:hypothetical protein